ncbi:MAG TPA: ABC transporter substrate-binding protein [Gaiellales bacterium]|jgi:peptide/nickel transport system substrate-binding protein|nr:ABC transporter substrate-binding protein [Gaiellales bacterium]
MTARRLLCLIALGLAGIATAAPASSAAPRHAAKDGGILRMGTTDPFDSMNPFVAFSAISYVAFTNVYPTLVQYDTHFKLVGDWAKSWKTSKDGLTWTFTLKPGKWSDGKPLTADDGAWTGNTILKFAKGPAASLAPFISHATKLTAPNPTTLVIHYDKAVANVLPQLQQFFVLPRHVWEPVVGSGAKGLKDYDPSAHMPIVGGGSFFVQKYDKKGTTILARNPGFYGGKPHVDAVGITWFANSDAMLAALKSNGLDYVDSVPQTVAGALGKSGDIQVIKGQGSEVRDFGFNSNPKKKKNRELLDPKLRDALSHAFDRQQIIDVVFRGLADARATFLTPLSTPYMNTGLKPERYDLALANRMLDKLGYKRGSDGIRRTPGANSHPMSYGVITPTTVAGINREFAIVRDSFAKIGVKLTQRAYDGTTAFTEITKPKNQYLDFDLMMWDWVGYIDPDFMLSVVGCDQYGGWSDTGYCNPAYDKLYQQQGVTTDPEKRQAIVWQMQKILYHDKPYIQLAQLQLIYGFQKGWTGIDPPFLTGLGKLPWLDLTRA